MSKKKWGDTALERSLVLFVTSSEPGPAGYLSRKGEDAAANACDTLVRFLADTGQLPLAANLEARVHSLSQDPQWASLKDDPRWTQGVEAALKFFPQLVLLCGEKVPTKLTLQPLAEAVALPVILNPRWDLSSAEIEQGKPGFAEAFRDLQNLPTLPSCFVVGCSLAALNQWVDRELGNVLSRPEQAEILKESLFEASEGGVGPAVMSVGLERQSLGSLGGRFQFVFDLE